MSLRSDILEFLEAEFLPEEHKEEQGGNLYVGIDPTINRLNGMTKEFDVSWNWDIKHMWTEETGKFTKNRWKNGEEIPNSGKPIYRATCVGTLCIPALGDRDGSGSDESFDMDTAVKSAQAYALRKAGNQFGVALYLKDADRRQDVYDKQNQAGAITALKSRLIEAAEDKSVQFEDDPDVNRAIIAEHYKVAVSDLDDINVLRRLVEGL